MTKASIATASESAPVRLNEHTRIGLGHRRECHAHPETPTLCIKVAREAGIAARADQNVVEWRNFIALERRGVPLRHVARCHAWIHTNRGPGLVCERIRNADGHYSQTLDQALADGAIELAQALGLLSELERWAVAYAVVVADLRSTDLMVRHGDSAMHLVFIDGLGGRRIDRDFVLRQRLPWLARRKTRRQWRQQGPATCAALKALQCEAKAARQ